MAERTRDQFIYSKKLEILAITEIKIELKESTFARENFFWIPNFGSIKDAKVVKFKEKTRERFILRFSKRIEYYINIYIILLVSFYISILYSIFFFFFYIIIFYIPLEIEVVLLGLSLYDRKKIQITTRCEIDSLNSILRSIIYTYKIDGYCMNYKSIVIQILFARNFLRIREEPDEQKLSRPILE